MIALKLHEHCLKSHKWEIIISAFKTDISSPTQRKKSFLFVVNLFWAVFIDLNNFYLHLFSPTRNQVLHRNRKSTVAWGKLSGLWKMATECNRYWKEIETFSFENFVSQSRSDVRNDKWTANACVHQSRELVFLWRFFML